MLGWMLKRGENAPVANPDGADTTEIEQPDTPAPVFAACALKSAFFGTPARPDPPRLVKNKPDTTSTAPVMQEDIETGSSTPLRPQGILLTPGTGASRRKRVSFGRDVVSKDLLGAPTGTRLGSQNPKTDAATPKNDDVSDDEWEEADSDDHCNHDITLDLNEPHSQSGRYWKQEFETYQKDARIEIGKLLKYKQMAKSYAQEKDAEAVELAEKLRDEQQKIIKMEKKIVENASQIALMQEADASSAPSDLFSKLAKQTALVQQYRGRIQDLENQLATLAIAREDESDAAGRRRRQAASPRTQKTLQETQRELRRAKAQVKELGELREQVASLKAQLRQSERQKSARPEKEAEMAIQLEGSWKEIKKKDEDLRLLRAEFDTFRQESGRHLEDSKAVLERAHNKITDLKKEVRSLKAAKTDQARPNSWHPQEDPPAQDKELEEKKVFASGSLDEYVDWPSILRHKPESATAGNDSIEVNLSGIKPQSLREKSTTNSAQDDEQIPDVPVPRSRSTLAQRPKLEQPRWQPFVPRSPRNRAYLGEVLSERFQNRGAASAVTKSKDIVAPDLPALGRSLSRPERRSRAGGRDSGGPVDLLDNGFAKLGGSGTEANANGTMLSTTSKNGLPPARRAAAIARIEQRMAEKKRAQKHRGFDKENVRPLAQ
jgi:hypothetical protein